MKYSNHLFVIIALLWSSNLFAYDIETEGMYFNFLSPTSLEVTYGDNEYEGDITIPDTVTYNDKKYAVIAVGTKAFYKCTKLKSIIMEKHITSVGDYAFYGCSSLSKYSFKTNNIGQYAFAYCTSIKGFKSTSMEYIPKGMFEGCTSLSNLSFSALTVGAYAFKGCTSIKGQITLRGHIGQYAFGGCTGITSVVIKSTSKTIAGTQLYDNAFAGCSGITKLTLKRSEEDKNNQFASIGGFSQAFAHCENLQEIVVDGMGWIIKDGGLYSNNGQNLMFLAPKREFDVFVTPDYLTRIGAFSISTGGNLRRLVLGGTIIKIADDAFKKCGELKELYIYNKDPKDITFNSVQSRYFEDFFPVALKNSLTVYVPKGSKDSYSKSFAWKEFKIEEFDVLTFDPYSGTTDINTYYLENKEVSRFTIDGKRILSPQKGINIIKMKDGTSKKVLVK